MNDSSFGKSVFILGVSLSGDMSSDLWESILPELYILTGLRPSHSSSIFDYAEKDFGEYLGYIHVQPIITSFIVLDAWPNLGGGYLHICSCKPFVVDDILGLIGKKYTVEDSFHKEMHLP